jgi:dCTP deaminase
LVLSRPDILRYIEEDNLKITPSVSPEQVAQVSIDLRLGKKFTVFKQPPAYLSAIRIDPSLWGSLDLWENQESSTFRLDPGKFVLAQTLERICIPSDLVGLVEGRSSWARVGITIHITAPKIDPGFDGHITLEMANFGSLAVELRAEIDKPAQLMLLKISSPLQESEVYGTGKQDTFQNQTDPIPHKPI